MGGGAETLIRWETSSSKPIQKKNQGGRVAREFSPNDGLHRPT